MVVWWWWLHWHWAARTGTGPTIRKAMTALGKEGKEGKEGKVVEQTGKHPRSQVGDWGR